MSVVETVTAGGGDTTVQLEKLYEIVNILGKRDLRMLLPLFETDPVDEADVQDIGQRGHHFSAESNIDFAQDPFVQGSLLAYALDGAAEALDMADHDDFSFGADGTAPNEPEFSIAIAVKFNEASSNTLIARCDETALSEEVEYRLFTTGGDDITMYIYDALAAVRIGRSINTPIVENVWYIIVATYNASRVNGGITIYLDGVASDDTNRGAGVYVAMHNTAVVTSIGYREDAAGALSTFLDGDFALPAITARCLSANDVLRLTRLYREVLEL